MESAEQSNHGKRTLQRNSNGHLSMSDTESTTSLPDSWHSPLRSESPLRSDDPSFRQENDEKNSKSLVLVDKCYSPVPSPRKSSVSAVPTAVGGKGLRPWPHSEKPTSENLDLPASSPAETPPSENLEKGTSPVVVGLNKMVRDTPVPPEAVKMEPGGGAGGGGGGLEAGYGGGGREEVGRERRSRGAVASILKRSERTLAMGRLALGLRVIEVICCLISFSVMAADKTQGWSGDSWDRYKEYRYCLAINVIGFLYSCFQAFDLGYHLSAGKHLVVHHLRYHFDFAMDQILAYFLISASSSAATRVDDWISNWGGDKFTLMASASIAMSFLAFFAFAMSSLISGYNLCNLESP